MYGAMVAVPALVYITTQDVALFCWVDAALFGNNPIVLMSTAQGYAANFASRKVEGQHTKNVGRIGGAAGFGGVLGSLLVMAITHGQGHGDHPDKDRLVLIVQVAMAILIVGLAMCCPPPPSHEDTPVEQRPSTITSEYDLMSPRATNQEGSPWSPRSVARNTSLYQLMEDPLLRVSVCILFFQAFAEEGSMSTINLYVVKQFDASTSQTSALLCCLTLGMIVLQVFVMPVMVRYQGEAWAIFTALFLSQGIFIWMCLADALWMFFPINMLNGFVFVILAIIVSTVAVRVPPKLATSAMSLLYCSGALAKCVSPLLYSYLAQQYNSDVMRLLHLDFKQVPFAFAALCVAAAITIAVCFLPQTLGKGQRQMDSTAH